jgi:photosystem II stability/assembly factor-like uncharacterized protein
MSLRKKTTIVGLATVAGVAACAPVAFKAYEDWKVEQRREALAVAEQAVARGLDYIPWTEDFAFTSDEDESGNGLDVDRDDAALRHMATLAEVGPRSPEFYRDLMAVAAEERERWAANPGDPLAITPTPVGSRAWRNIGPAAQRSSYNGTYYKSVDTGRLNQIVQHPADPKRVFIATAGGGVWGTSDFGNYPFWAPMTDGLGNLAVGAFTLDPANPDVMWVGFGDGYDLQGGGLAKSTDAGLTWSAVIPLGAPAHPADPTRASVNENVRNIAIDPLDSARMLVAGNDGLYRSTDGGATFGLIDLPNTAATGPVRESVWSVTYLGNASGQSHWLVSGHYACPGALPPHPASGSQNRLLSTARCADLPGTPADERLLGSYGDIWKSTDSGATWVSMRATGALPASVVGAHATDVGLIHLAASGTADPAATVVYAMAGSLSDSAQAASGALPATTASRTAAFLKSVDGGSTWTVVATDTTPMVNPTAFVADCTTMNVGHDQSWYNVAIGVDPVNPNFVVAGGNLCGVRSRDGGQTWENMAHWLPKGGGGYTSNGGFLPYVHADWHVLRVTRVNGKSVVFAGTDGGLHVSYNMFDVDSPESIAWEQPDVGITTHLPYSAGSGDPVHGTGSVAMAGLQDNGTRFRLVTDEHYIFEFDEGNWDQIRGGDGIGTAVVNSPTGQNPVYWISVQGQQLYCQPRRVDCGRASRVENGVEKANYRRATVTLPAGDGYPFLIRYSAINDAASSVLTATNNNLWRIRVDPQSDAATWTRLTPSGITAAGATRGLRGLGGYASPHTYSIGGQSARIYGMPLTSGASGIVVDFGATTQVVGGSSPVGAGGQLLGFIQSVAIPKDPASIGGTDPTRTWVVSSAAALDLSNQPIAAAVGHLFKTTDAGATWVPFHGNGTGQDLPNIPVWVVRFDPTDDSIIYVGTDIGMYRSTDGGNTWAPYGTGLPKVRVYDMSIASNGTLMRIATYGRGLWEINPRSEASAEAGNGDWDGNGVVDYFDMQAAATRLNLTPASNDYLPYDAKLDLAGSATTLEESDLSALTAKFGSAP